VLGTAGDGDGGGVQPSQPEQMLLRGFATPLLRDSGSVMGRPPGHLLTVREAARLLRVSTATVYKLCARGELGHVRVLNALRIPERGLDSLRSAGQRPLRCAHDETVPEEEDAECHEREGVLDLVGREKLSGCLDERTAFAVREPQSMEQVGNFSRWPDAPVGEPDQELVRLAEGTEVLAHHRDAATGIVLDLYFDGVTGHLRPMALIYSDAVPVTPGDCFVTSECLQSNASRRHASLSYGSSGYLTMRPGNQSDSGSGPATSSLPKSRQPARASS